LSRIRNSWRYACIRSWWSLEEVVVELTGKTGLTVSGPVQFDLYWTSRLAQEFQTYILSFWLSIIHTLSWW
jgi:hypothetical protein